MLFGNKLCYDLMLWNDLPFWVERVKFEGYVWQGVSKGCWFAAFFQRTFFRFADKIKYLIDETDETVANKSHLLVQKFLAKHFYFFLKILHEKCYPRTKFNLSWENNVFIVCIYM